jgi:translation initiation factor 2 alpha subunit (eIF-2alpha)
MAESISPQLLKVLTDVTGEVKLDSALRIVAQEAVAHRLERVAEQIHTLEQKYGTSFEQFDQRFQAGEIPGQHGYEIEQDYLEWEGLLCRQRRLKEVEEWLR